MLTEGMYIADRYEVIGKIGAGGMSDVYKAKDLTLGRFVAIKVLKAEFSEDMNFVTKFRTEAQSAAGLEHPNIVNIYDVGSEKGMHYIVMEYVEGITLKTYIEKKGQLSFKEAVSIAIQVGRGIEAAHGKGIIHRDIKPQNIMISTEGKVKVTDFGIARAASGNTISSDVMGSVHYSSPEQARNGFVDGKSDIYSLGIVMYEMVTGRVPFDGDTTVAVAIQHLQEEMVTPSAYAPNLPISMEKIILKCTQKNADRRYESMTALLTDLRKSLVSPNEDFVVMVPAVSQDKTRIIAAEEIRQIKKETGSIHIPVPERVEPDDDEEDGDDFEGGDEGELNPRMEKAITIMGIVAAVVIVGIIVALVINLFGGFGGSGKKDKDSQSSQSSQSTESTQTTGNTQARETESAAKEQVPVPELRGKTFEEAKEQLEGLGLGIENKGEISSNDYEEGKVANQDPLAGGTVEKGKTVAVVISSGKGTIDVPGVTGEKDTDAIAKLTEPGFVVEKKYSYSSTVQENYVINQSPAAGAQGKPGDTIIIEISQGPELVTVPDVQTTYKSEEQARGELSDFAVTVTQAYSDMIPAGIVMQQSLAPYSKAEKGAAITITVSLGPEPSQVVTATTYKFKITIRQPADISNVSGADIVLYDTAGNILEQWNDQDISKFGDDGLTLTKSGLMVNSGKLVITWLDLDGDELNDQTVDDLSKAFTKES